VLHLPRAVAWTWRRKPGERVSNTMKLSSKLYCFSQHSSRPTLVFITLPCRFCGYDDQLLLCATAKIHG
jgi:hypothetical protein